MTTPEFLKQTFHWRNVFKYNNDDNDTIATDPAFSNDTLEILHFVPGQSYIRVLCYYNLQSSIASNEI